MNLLQIDPMIISKLVLAMVLGGIIGFDRELKHKAAGLRTHMLVCLTSALLLIGITSQLGQATEEVARVMQAIMTGIGFLGAGTIISRGGHIYGLTTAASVWCVAGVGIIVGMGQFVTALIATLLVIILLRAKVIDRMFLR